MDVLIGTPITKDIFEAHPNVWEHDEPDEKMIRTLFPDYVCFRSRTDYLRENSSGLEYYVRVFNNLSNMNVDWWTIQIDNLDHEGVASFSVRTIEDANRMLLTYGLRIGRHMDDIYYNPSWFADVVLAELALPILKEYVKRTQGYPPQLTWKEWHKILGHIIFAFEMMVDDDRLENARDWYIKRNNEKGWEIMYDRVVEGQRLFGQWMHHMWW
jgi:hypothetical protein